MTEIDRYFQTAGPGFTYCSYGADRLFLNQDHAAYFSQIPLENLDAAIVFLDPDNGLEVRSATDRNMQKYVKFEEVKSIYDKMSADSCLVVYQHLPRIDRKMLLYSLHRDLTERLKCPVPITITDNQIAFLMLTKEKDRREEIDGLLHEYVRSSLQILD